MSAADGSEWSIDVKPVFGVAELHAEGTGFVD